MYIHVSLHYFAPFSTVSFQEEMPLFKSLEWKVDILNEYVQVHVHVYVRVHYVIYTCIFYCISDSCIFAM